MYWVELVIRAPGEKRAPGGMVLTHKKRGFRQREAALQQLMEWREEYEEHDEFLYTNTWTE
jgi:hypothetical protein